MEIDVTPHPSLIEKIGHTSFTVWQSISELIANSLDAMPKNKTARIEIDVNLERIVVKDNGQGMDQKVLEKAVRMAWPMDTVLPYERYSKKVYGLGMKTACASLGRKWSIETITKDSSIGYKVTFDFEKMLDVGTPKWVAEIETFDRGSIVLPDDSKEGTIIIIEKLKVKPIPDRLKKEIAQAYLPHIREGDIFIINGTKLSEAPIEFIPDSRVDVDVTIEGVRIKGWGALMRKGSLTYYGFNWYRNNQLIEAYDKSFIPNHPTYRQIFGELHADNMPVNFTKKGFEKESKEWKQAVEELPTHFAQLLNEAKKTKRERSPDPWKQKEMAENLDTINRVSKSIAERMEVEGSSTGGDYLDAGLIEEINADMSERDKKVEDVVKKVSNPVKIGDQEIKWRHTFRSMGENAPITDYILEGDNLIFITNEDSPFAKFIDHDDFLAIMSIADGFMKFLIEELDFDAIKAFDFRERLLVTTCAARLEKL